MRRIRMLKKAQEAALAEALGSQQAQQGEGGGDHDAVVHALREEAAPAGAPQQAQQQQQEEEQHRQQQQQQQEVGAEEAGQPEEGAVEAMQVDGGGEGRPAAARGVLAATTKDNLPERPAGEAPDGTVRVDASRACEGQKAVAAPAAAAAQPGLALVEAQRPGLPGTQQQQQREEEEGPAAGGEAAAAPVPLPAAPAEREASPADLARAEALQQALAGKTEGLLVEPLEVGWRVSQWWVHWWVSYPRWVRIGGSPIHGGCALVGVLSRTGVHWWVSRLQTWLWCACVLKLHERSSRAPGVHRWHVRWARQTVYVPARCRACTPGSAGWQWSG